MVFLQLKNYELQIEEMMNMNRQEYVAHLRRYSKKFNHFVAIPFALRISVRSHIGSRGERNILYKGVVTSPTMMESANRTIYASGGLGLLQMILEPDTGQCASDDTGLPRGVDCEIPYQLKRGMKHFL